MAVILPQNLISQSVSTDNGLGEIYPKTFKHSVVSNHDPINEWPLCSEPKNIIISEDREEYIVTWDGLEKSSDKYSYEIELFDESGSRYDDTKVVQTNKLSINKSKIGRNTNFEIKIRRVCFSNAEKLYYSQWVHHVYAAPLAPCDAGAISNNFSVCANANFTIASTYSGTGGNYQWQYKIGNCSSSNQWVNISNSNVASLNYGPISQTTSFRRTISCGISSNCMTVTVNQIPSANISGNNSLCAGQSTTLTASGGTAYTWSHNLGTGATKTVTPSSTTTYTVTVTNASGCTATTTRTVTVNTINAAITGNNSLTCGQSSTLTASGGTSYAWSHNLGTGAIKTVSPLLTTTYTVTVSNSNGCTNTAIRTVTVNPSADASISGNSSMCTDQTTILTASGSGTYLWSNNASSQSINVSPSATTTYTVTVTNANGCISSASHVLSVNNISFSNFNASGCNSQNNQYSISITVNFSLPYTGTITFLDNSGISQNFSVTNQTSFTGQLNNLISNGLPHVLNIIPSNCSSALHAYTAPNACVSCAASINGNTTICQGNSTVLNASQGNAYQWSNGATTQSINVSPATTSLFTVTVTNSNNGVCSATTNVFVNPTPNAAISGPPSNVCTSNLPVTLTASGGGTYLWSTNANNNSITVSPISATNYFVTVTSSQGCTAVASKLIVPTVCNGCQLGITGDTSICSGESSVLSVASNCEVTSYLWSTGATTQSITVSPSIYTLYSVTVTHSGYQTTVLQRPVNISANPIASISGNTSICAGEQTTLTASGGQTYVWSNGNVTSETTITLDTSATFTVTVTNASGCSSSTSVNIIVNCTQQCNLNSPPPSIGMCSNSLYTLSGIGTVTNPSDDEVIIQVGTVVTTVPINNQNGAFNYTIPELTANGQTQYVHILLPGCDTIVHAFFAPANCNPAGSFTYTTTACDPVSNSFNLVINLTVSNPVPGQTITFTEGGTTFGSIILSTATNYTFTFDNIIANGDPSSILMEAPWGNVTQQYTKQSDCLPNVCNIYEIELAASACNKITQKFNLEGIFKIEHPVDYGTFYVSIVGSTTPVQTIYSTGASEYTFAFPNLNTNGSELTISVTHTNICGSANKKIKSPSGCNDLPEYLCGVSTALPPSNSTTLLTNASAGDIFIVSGMAFRCDTITGSNGLYSGVGSLSIPFSSKKLKVRFTNITVNNEYHVTDGSVYGVRAQPSENYNIPQEPINIGGDICVVESVPEGLDEDGFDKKTGLNDRGFGKDGKHYPGGNTYDANGYDYQGNHKDTNGPYDLYGCDVENMTIDEKPCLRDTIDKIKKDSIINTVLDSLPTWITKSIGDVNKKLNALKCDSLTSRINTLITDLGFAGQSQYIVGASGQYLNKGMHKNFDSEPKLLLDNSGRDPNAIDLEKTHVELYKCDLFRDKLERALEQINNIDPAKFESYLVKEIKKLSKDQVDAILDDSQVMMEWVLSKLVDYAQNPDSYGYIMQPDLPQIRQAELPKRKSKSSAYYSVAGLDDYSFKPKEGEEEKWLFNQGFKEINGVNRGLYLESLYDEMQQESTLDVLSGGDEPIMMPIPLIKDVEGLPYKIFLDNIELSASVAKLDAFFVFQDPTAQNGQKFVMMGENIHFGPGGLIGETKLKLKTPIDLRLNNAVMLHLLPAPATGNGGCYVSWDCSGFNSLNIDGRVELCRNFIVPLDPVTKDTIPSPERYAFDFTLNVKGWHDIYLEINNNSNKPFAIAGYTDFKWTVTGVVIDNSDFKSPSGISFIEGYSSEHLTGTGASAKLDNSWRGVAMKTLEVTLPPIFNNNGKAATTGVQNLLIDDSGVNGRIFGTPIIPYETGNLAGWQFSLDTLKIDILRTNINGGGLAGKIRVPVLKNPTRYSAMIYKGGKFEFSISPSTNEKMDFLLADVTLDKNSKISVIVNKGDADVFAELHGTIQMQSDKIKIPKITFVNFKVGNKDPYFNAGTWKIENEIEAKLFGFKLNVKNIIPFSPAPKQAGISFDISVDLPKKLTAGGGLEVIGKMETDGLGRQNWVYETTRVNKFLVDGTIAAGRLYGFLETFDEATSGGYGNGFHGMIEMDFTGLAKVDAVALFATKGEDKFFFVDAAVSLPTGIPVGPFAITGFAGGASYMMQETFSDNDPPEQSKKTLPAPGTSLSGTKYVFDKSKGLGLKAGITFGLTSSPEAFNGSLVFGIQFNNDDQGGGVANISMDGKGQFMMKAKITGPKVESDSTSAPSGVPGKIKAHVRFVYDFNKKEFSGRMAAFINAPGITGQGKVQVLANKNQWYLYIGTPNEPVFLRFSLPPFGTVDGSTYLDIGSVVPNMREIPANVRAVAYKVKQSSLRASGGGFVFGVSLTTNMVADAKIATAKLTAEIGFDVMIRNFGNASCAANPGEKIGINGWYAMGQIYAFMEGTLKIFGVNIFSAAIAGVLQAELPNPFFGQATLGVRIKTFLGSFNKSVALVLGKRCEIASDPSVSPLGMKVITAVNPADKAEKMETDFVPGATFNLPMNVSVEMGQDVWKPILKKFTLTSLKNQHVYAVDTIFSDDRGSFEAKPKTMFYAGDSIKFEVEVEVIKNGGNSIFETQSSIFTVGKGYANVPKANIESSYPIDGMQNYYRREDINQSGFIQLQQGMPEIFYNIPSGVTQKIRITTKSTGETKMIDFTYNGLNARIKFDMKPEWFSNGEQYTIDLVRTGDVVETTPSSGGQSASQQGSQLGLGSALGNPAGPAAFSDTEEAMPIPGETILTTISFRVSTFDKFLDKMNSGSVIMKNGLPVYEVQGEKFDGIELNELVDLKINDPKNWMTLEAYSKIFTVNINLSDYGCGIVYLPNGQEKFEELNNEISIELSKNTSSTYFINNIYKKALEYHNDLYGAVNGCDVGNANIIDPATANAEQMQIWTLLNNPLNPPSPPLDLIVTYTIPGLGTTSTKTLSF